LHRLAPAARDDLDDIWDFVFEESKSEEIANRLLDRIVERFRLLSTYPAIGRSRDQELGSGARVFPVGNYLIVYRIVRSDVLILRVANGRRDLKALVNL